MHEVWPHTFQSARQFFGTGNHFEELIAQMHEELDVGWEETLTDAFTTELVQGRFNVADDRIDAYVESSRSSPEAEAIARSRFEEWATDEHKKVVNWVEGTRI